jgi:hypothetical protein
MQEENGGTMSRREVVNLFALDLYGAGRCSFVRFGPVFIFVFCRIEADRRRLQARLMPELNVQYRRGRGGRVQLRNQIDRRRWRYGHAIMIRLSRHGFADYTLVPEKCRSAGGITQRRRADFASPNGCCAKRAAFMGDLIPGAVPWSVAMWSLSPYEIPALPNQLAPREPPGGSLAIGSDRTQHGKD